MSVGSTASSSPSPNAKARRNKQHDYYRLVEEVFQEYSIVRSVTDVDLQNQNKMMQHGDLTAPIIPRSRLPLACSRLRLSFAPSEITTLMESSRCNDGLDRDEFVQLVHDNLGRRTTAEEVIFNVVQLNPSGEMTADELREFLLSDALYTMDRRAEPLNDEEFDMFMDQLDPRQRGLVHVGRFVRVMCPDESESVIERLLEKYGVGESRRLSQREHLITLETVGRLAMRDWEVEEHVALAKTESDDAARIQYSERQLAAREAAERLQRENDARRKAEEAARRAEEEARRAAEDARKQREREEAERVRLAAAAEEARRKAAEEERLRQEKELQRLRKAKAEAGCCKVDYSK